MNELDAVFDQLISTYSRSEFEERLEYVDESQARARPIEGRHTIWEIVNHCAYWMEAAIGAVNGEEMPPRGGDWPPMGESEKTWREDQVRLGRALDGLVESVTGLDGGRLHEMVPGGTTPTPSSRCSSGSRITTSTMRAR